MQAAGRTCLTPRGRGKVGPGHGLLEDPRQPERDVVPPPRRHDLETDREARAAEPEGSGRFSASREQRHRTRSRQKPPRRSHPLQPCQRPTAWSCGRSRSSSANSTLWSRRVWKTDVSSRHLACWRLCRCSVSPAGGPRTNRKRFIETRRISARDGVPRARNRRRGDRLTAARDRCIRRRCRAAQTS